MGSLTDILLSTTPASTLKEYLQVAAALNLNQRPRVSSDPPIFNLVVEDTTREASRIAGTDLAAFKPTVSKPTPEVPDLTQRATEDLDMHAPPRLNKGKRVMSLPPGGMAGHISMYGDLREGRPLTKGGRVLRVPTKLGGEHGRERWSDVPTNWRHGAVDPLRCHSVDRLPPPSWQLS